MLNYSDNFKIRESFTVAPCGNTLLRQRWDSEKNNKATVQVRTNINQRVVLCDVTVQNHRYLNPLIS